RRMRVDTTVVETNVHHPTDSTLLGDGVRVLTRMMKKITTAGRWGSGADPHDEEDHKYRGRGRNQAARPQPERKVPAAGDRSGGARQGFDRSGQVEAALWSAVGCNEPGGGTGEALLRGDIPRREAGEGCSGATGT